MSWCVFCCPLTLLLQSNTKDCLEVCAIIILKPAGMLYMYQHETVMRIFKNVDLHMKNISLKLMKMLLQTKNNPTHHLLFQTLIQAHSYLNACLKYHPVDGKFLTLALLPTPFYDFLSYPRFLSNTPENNVKIIRLI